MVSVANFVCPPLSHYSETISFVTGDFAFLAVKNVVLAGFGHITLLDLDTIDLSNLNRQFLFRKKDVKQSKALVRRSPATPSSYSESSRFRVFSRWPRAQHPHLTLMFI